MAARFISDCSPVSGTRRRQKVYLALQQIDHPNVTKDKEYTHSVQKNLSIIQNLMEQVGRQRESGFLTIDASTCNAEAYDQAFIHVRSPMRSNEEIEDTFQLQFPRYTFSGNREQHFFMDVNEENANEGAAEEASSVISASTTLPAIRFISVTIASEDDGGTDCHSVEGKMIESATKSSLQSKKEKNSFGNLRVDTSVAVDLQTEKWFFEGHRFHEKLRPQDLSAGFDRHLVDADKKCEEDMKEALHEVERLPARSKLLEELHDIEMRRVQQEEEIQELLLRSKQHAQRMTRRFLRYLTDHDIGILDKRLARRKLVEMEEKNMKQKKKEKKKKPRWLQLYEDSQQRAVAAKRRSMKIKRASSETLISKPRTSARSSTKK